MWKSVVIAQSIIDIFINILFGGYSNVSLHFVSKKLFHQITPYMIITRWVSKCMSMIIFLKWPKNLLEKWP